MDLTSYVDRLRRELAVAAEAGGEDARDLAERLTGPLDAATRLVLMEALSAAADEITRDLAPGSVEVRLRGRDPDFVVTPPLADDSFDDEAAPDQHGGLRNAPAGAVEVAMGGGPVAEGGSASSPTDVDEGGTSRITLRLPERLKPRIDEAAGRAGLSVNAWLVRVIAAALVAGDPGQGGHPGSGPGSGLGPGRRAGTGLGRGFTGWVR
jgi:hypothetical protein